MSPKYLLEFLLQFFSFYFPFALLFLHTPLQSLQDSLLITEFQLPQNSHEMEVGGCFPEHKQKLWFSYRLCKDHFILFALLLQHNMQLFCLSQLLLHCLLIYKQDAFVLCAGQQCKDITVCTDILENFWGSKSVNRVEWECQGGCAERYVFLSMSISMAWGHNSFKL